MAVRANWSLDYDYMVNWTNGTGNFTIYFNITELNNTKFMNGNSSQNISNSPYNISVQQDNNTDLNKISFRIQGYSPYPANATISFLGKTIFSFPGKVKENITEINEFSYLGTKYKAGNITLLSGGSATIQLNTSNSLSMNDFIAYLSGYDLDANNQFSKEELFTSSFVINDSLSYNTEAPLGMFDNFENNVSGRWSSTDASSGSGYTTLMGYTFGNDDDTLSISSTSGSTSCTTRTGAIYLDYNDASADWRNTSVVELKTEFSVSASCGASCGAVGTANVYYYITDGTNNVILKNYIVSQGTYGSTSSSALLNITLQRVSDTSVNVIINGSANSVSISSLDQTQQLKLKFYVSANSGGSCSGGAASATASINLYNLKWGGVWLNNSLTNGTYWTNGNFTKCGINISQNNISKATLSWQEYKPTGTNVLGYISNNCNNSAPTFESTTSGTLHTFSTIGNNIGVRFALNTSINITSPIIRKFTTSVVKSSIENVSLDCNNDGTSDWNYPTNLNSTTSPKVANCTLFTSCSNGVNCLRLLSFSSSTGGILSVDNINATQTLSELSISNLTPFESLTFWNLTADFLNGRLRLYDLDVEFNGSKNISLGLHSVPTSFLLEGTDNLTLSVYHSKARCTYPSGIQNFEFVFGGVNETNMTIVGQEIRQCNSSVDTLCVHTSTPIYNCTLSAYDLPADFYLYSNATINASINHSFDLGVNRTTAIRVDTSAIKIISSLPIKNSKSVFGFTDFVNMTWSKLGAIDFNYEFVWKTFCVDCVR